MIYTRSTGKIRVEVVCGKHATEDKHRAVNYSVSGVPNDDRVVPVKETE